MKAIYEYRALATNQVEALLFAPDKGQPRPTKRSACRYRLQLLYHYGFVFRDEQPQKLSEGRKPLVYFLDEAGAEWLAEQLGEDVDWQPRDNDVAYYPFLEHLLATNDVRVAMEISARNKQWRIVEWLDDQALKSPQMKDVITLRGPQGGEQQAAVVPDGYCHLETAEKAYHFFVEADLRNVTAMASKWGVRDWARKVQAYLEYHRSGKYEERYGTKDMRVLTVTTGERRLAHLKAVTEKAGGKARFWFTTFEAIKSGDILTSPIWKIASRGDTFALI